MPGNVLGWISGIFILFFKQCGHWILWSFYNHGHAACYPQEWYVKYLAFAKKHLKMKRESDEPIYWVNLCCVSSNLLFCSVLPGNINLFLSLPSFWTRRDPCFKDTKLIQSVFFICWKIVHETWLFKLIFSYFQFLYPHIFSHRLWRYRPSFHLVLTTWFSL